MGLENQRGWTREGILRALRDRIEAGQPIVGAGSSAGIVAKSAEAGGADLIIVYSTGRSRLMGLATTPIGQPNEVTMAMYDEIANVVESTPIIGGAQAGDPTYLRLNRLVDAFARTGFDGVINFPSAGLHPEYARKREHIGQGLRREAELIAESRRQGLLTLGYAYTDEHTRLLTEAGVDILVPHAGWTTGGDLGADPDLARGMDEAVEHVQRLIDIARGIEPDVIVLAHGGAIASPADTRELYRRTDAQGFLGASSIERIPIEHAVRETVAAFKAERLTPTKTRVNDDPKELGTMKTSKVIRGTAMIAAAGLVLAGCSGESGDDGGTPELTISSWQWSEPTRGAALWSVYEGIDEANDDFTLSKIDLAYTQTLDTLSTQLGAGTGPDIIYVTEPMFYPLAAAGLLEPLDSLIPAEELENLRDQNEWGHYDGAQYGYISEMANFGLIYNQDLLDEAGVEVPTSFDELVEAATAVTENTDAFGFATRNQVDETDGWYLDYKNWVVGFGGELSENGELTLNSPESVQAAEAYKEMWDAEVMPIGANVQEYRQMFIDGQLAMLLENNGNFSAALATNPDLNAGVALTPFPSREADATTLFVAVNAASDHKEEAAEVIRTFLQPETQEQWVSNLGGSLGPLDTDLPADMLAENPWMEPFQEAAASAHRMTIADFETDTPQIQTILVEALAEVMLTDRDPQEALDAVQEEAEQLVGD